MPTFSRDCLKGKNILITGGLGSIGKVVAERLLAHAARLVVNDVVPEDEAGRWMAATGCPAERCRYIRADITNSLEARSLVSRTIEFLSRLDVALCHAGLVRPGPILECSERDWDETLALNLKGAFLVAQSAASVMVQQGIKGKIIFTSSWVQDVPWPEITPYTVSKSGMKMLMRGMARELAAKGIRVNAIAPGIVAVGMAKRQWETEPDYRRRAEKAIPLGFMQPPESVADALIFLCSDASDYMTGATLLIDGGCSLYPMD